MASKLKQGYLYLYFFLLIYIEFGYHMVIENQIPGQTRMWLLIFATIPVLFLGKKRLPLNKFLLFLFMIFIVFANLALRGDNFGNYLLLAIPIIIGFCVAISLDKRTFIRIYSNLILFLAAYSLVIYFISLVAPGVIKTLPLIGVRYESQVHDAFFSIALTNAQYLRNYGIAWEPGAFALLMGLALYFELICVSKINFKRVIILSLAIITTFSTLGYIFIALLFVSVFVNSSRNKKKYGGILFFTIAFIALIFILLPADMKDLVFSKLGGIFGGSSSDIAYTTETRINAIIYPFNAFCQSPLFGVGYDRFSVINKTLCDNVATNTIINWFALFGLPFGIPCAYCYLRNIYLDRAEYGLNIASSVVLTVAFCLLVSTESLLRISLIYIMIFYGCSNFTAKRSIS